jgi:DMSO/TMAO reductase YedYZ molybdopterin-dependent catalytic subunit
MDKLTAAKEARAREQRLPPGPRLARDNGRLPPGQSLTAEFPVLDLGHRPNLSVKDWSLTLGGRIRAPGRLDWAGFGRLPRRQVVGDIHCVTGWSRYDNAWEGVTGADLITAMRPTSEARFVLLKGYDGYTTCVPMADFTAPGVLVATAWQGRPLERDHGGPVRLVLPQLYFWKSIKWLRQVWLTDQDIAGTWESRGYHRRGDPWREERYGR